MIEVDPDLFGRFADFYADPDDKQKKTTTGIIRGFSSEGKGIVWVLIECEFGFVNVRSEWVMKIT